MPQSRRRTQKKTRPHASPPAPHDDDRDGRVCYRLSGPDLLSQMEELRTEEDVRAFRDAADAEANGEAELAIECLLRGMIVSGTPRIAHLREVADLGDEAPSWALARWVVDQAYRWMLMEEDSRVEDAVISVVATCYPGVDLERPLGLSRREFGTRLAASDWVVNQIATYELGGLSDFLDTRISDTLLARCGPMREWASPPIGGYRLRHGVGGVLDVQDLGDGSRTRVLDLGALFERGRSCTVIGRIVPTDTAPGLMFESRPLQVDLVTARAVALSPDGLDWLEALYDARRGSRLPLHFSAGQATPMTSDVLPTDGWGSVCTDEPAPHDQQETAGRSVELQALGLDALRANNVMVCELALLVAKVSPDALGSIGVSLHAVLTDRATFEAARVHCVDRDHAQHWSALADVVPDPTRSRCLELSELCRYDGRHTRSA